MRGVTAGAKPRLEKVNLASVSRDVPLSHLHFNQFLPPNQILAVHRGSISPLCSIQLSLLHHNNIIKRLKPSSLERSSVQHCAILPLCSAVHLPILTRKSVFYCSTKTFVSILNHLCGDSLFIFIPVSVYLSLVISRLALRRSEFRGGRPPAELAHAKRKVNYPQFMGP